MISIDNSMFSTYPQSQINFALKKSVRNDHNDNLNRSMCADFISYLVFHGEAQIQSKRASWSTEPETMASQWR